MSARATAAPATDLLTAPLLTHELGSLAKPNWRVKSVAGMALDDRDIEEATDWGRRLEVPGHEELVALLGRGPLDADGKAEVKRWSSRYGVRLLESVGLDVVYDGEQQRSEMYQWAVAHAEGFDWRGSVRAFDNKYYSKAAVTGPIGLRKPYHNEEFAFVRDVATAELKVPITGAYTIGDWSFDEHYFSDAAPGIPTRDRRRDARRRMILDVATGLIRPNLEALIGLGARWLQIDEPAGSTGQEELDLFVESFNASVEGLDAVFSTHLCFSDYNLFFPAIEGMTECRQFAVGFANYDSRDPGTGPEDRPGYRVLPKFRDLPYRPVLGIGVLDIHTDFIEPPELVRDRILHSVEVFGDPARIHVIPDCGLRTRSWEVAHAKLRNMVDGVALAKKDLGI
jgi:5-methyltetrahydropteroyltriglutamate--homocysteine methyltransferase